MATAIVVEDEDMDADTGEMLPVRVNGNGALAMLRPIASPAAVIEAQNATRAFVKEALQQGRDFGVIPGVAKPTLLKPGAERTNAAFGVVAEFRIIEREIDHNRVVPWRKTKAKYEWHGNRKGKKIGEEVTEGESLGLYRYVVECVLKHRETGVTVGSCVASCSTMESKYIDRPRDCENTALKMAEKRALVGAVLLTYGLSDEFTQDVEDMPREQFGGEGGDGASHSNEPEAKCPKCGGKMWDNRTERDGSPKKNPRAPDFKCRDKDCVGVYWPGQWPPAATEAPKEETREGAHAAPEGGRRPLPIPGAEHEGQPLNEIPMDSLKNYADQCKAVLAKQRKQGKDTTATEGLLEDIALELDARAADMTPEADPAVVEQEDELPF